MVQHNRRLGERRDERRKGNDLILQVLSWLGLFGWLLMLIALVVVDRAKPKHMEVLLGNIDANSQVPQLGWNDRLLYYVFILMVVGFFVSVIGLYLNSMRRRRRTDSYRVHLVFLLIISTLGIVYYLI